MNTFAWWKGGPVAASAVLTREQLQTAYDAVANMEPARTPIFFMSPTVQHLYRCLLARFYWKQAYRDYRMFKRACEMGWMNGRY